MVFISIYYFGLGMYGIIGVNIMKEKINKIHLYLQNVSTIKFILIMEIFLSFIMLTISPFYHIYLSQIDVQKNISFITTFLQENNFITVAIGVAIIVQSCAIMCNRNSTCTNINLPTLGNKIF